MMTNAAPSQTIINTKKLRKNERFICRTTESRDAIPGLDLKNKKMFRYCFHGPPASAHRKMINNTLENKIWGA